MQSVLVQLCSHVTRHARVSSPSRLRLRMAQTERRRDSETEKRTGEGRKRPFLGQGALGPRGLLPQRHTVPSLVASS